MGMAAFGHGSPLVGLLGDKPKIVARRQSTGVVVFNCNEQTAHALIELAERHCGCAWRVMHSQMTRLGLLKEKRPIQAVGNS